MKPPARQNPPPDPDEEAEWMFAHCVKSAIL